MEPDKIKPEHNPWYLLATLHGEAESLLDRVLALNRTAWNRFMAAEWTEDARALLIKEGRCSAEDLIPFTAEELSEVERLFFERHRQAIGEAGTAGASPPLPNLKQDRIDFSNVMFDRPFLAKGFLFHNEADFSGATFSDWAFFSDATFSGRTVFLGVTFSDGVEFRGATFSGWDDFLGATFSGRADFSGATFSRGAHFTDATFSDQAAFSGATFSGEALFWATTFSGWAVFRGTTFSGFYAYFGRATFSDGAEFWGATFSDRAEFGNATFEKESVFVNVKMEGPTSFENATFSTAPPQFFGAKLHEGTVWRGVKWPPPPKDHIEAGPFVDAYERLKLEMDRLKKHEDELDFFALEMQSRRVLHGDWHQVRLLETSEKRITPGPRKLFGRTLALPSFTIKARTLRLFRPAPGLAIALYGGLSNYGRSYVRPLCWLLATVLAGVLPFWWHLCKFWQATGLSLANTFGVLGFRRELIGPETLTALPGVLKAVAALQTVAGIVLLFLLGLAIRNRFRMK